MNPLTTTERTSTENYLHEFRTKIDENIKFAEAVLSSNDKPRFIREMALVRTKLQEAKMWCGKCLEVEGAPFPEELRDEAKANDENCCDPADNGIAECGLKAA